MFGVPLFQELNKQIDEFNIIRGFFEGYFGELPKEAEYQIKAMWKRLILVVINNLN